MIGMKEDKEWKKPKETSDYVVQLYHLLKRKEMSKKSITINLDNIMFFTKGLKSSLREYILVHLSF